MNKTTKNIIIRLSMLIGLALFVFLGVMAKINRTSTPVKSIKIGIDTQTDNFLVNEEEVLEVINKNHKVVKRVLSGKDLEKIEKSVQSIPQVSRANAYLDDKGNLNVKIDQRIPMFRVYNRQGQSFYVDENGMKFPTSDKFTVNVPIVTGLISETDDTISKIQEEHLKKVYNIIQTINKNSLWKSMIGQYNINDEKQIELIPRFGDAIILFGNDKNVEQKIKQLDVFYFDVLKKVGWDYYKVINIMYKNQVVCIK